MKRFSPRQTRYQKPTALPTRAATPVQRTSHGRALLLPILVIVGLFGFGLLYVSQTNAAATQGIAIRGLEERLADVTVETQELELRIATFQSLATVEQSSAILDLLVRAPVHYLPAVSSAGVALKD